MKIKKIAWRLWRPTVIVALTFKGNTKYYLIMTSKSLADKLPASHKKMANFRKDEPPWDKSNINKVTRRLLALRRPAESRSECRRSGRRPPPPRPHLRVPHPPSSRGTLTVSTGPSHGNCMPIHGSSMTRDTAKWSSRWHDIDVSMYHQVSAWFRRYWHIIFGLKNQFKDFYFFLVRRSMLIMAMRLYQLKCARALDTGNLKTASKF